MTLSAARCLRASSDRRRALRSLAAAAVAGLALSACSDTAAMTDAVSVEVARAELQAGRAVLVDIREPEEHANGVAPGARLVPLRQLGKRLSEIPADPAQPVLLICHTQSRSSATLRALRGRGYGNVRYVTGGMSEWSRRGFPTVRPAERPGN
ncbi:MAG: rhodanese-like domain-containing protein [bacterium]|nr:rhodanese-like domain-containing protein [Betaproteobacteria bacterium]